jgi:hypothetical protein
VFGSDGLLNLMTRLSASRAAAATKMAGAPNCGTPCCVVVVVVLLVVVLVVVAVVVGVVVLVVVAVVVGVVVLVVVVLVVVVLVVVVLVVVVLVVVVLVLGITKQVPGLLVPPPHIVPSSMCKTMRKFGTVPQTTVRAVVVAPSYGMSAGSPSDRIESTQPLLQSVPAVHTWPASTTVVDSVVPAGMVPVGVPEASVG